MISLEISMVQYNSLQSAILNAQVDEFLRHGGVIESAPPLECKPRPVAKYIEAPQKVARPKEEKKLGRPPRSHPQELIDRIVVMAETMTCVQVAEEVRLSTNQLHCIAYRHGFRFLAGMHGRPRDPQPKAPSKLVDESQDLICAERIRAYRDLGICRHQTIKRMGIGTGKFYRLIAKYEIDFPKNGGNTWVMPA